MWQDAKTNSQEDKEAVMAARRRRRKRILIYVEDAADQSIRRAGSANKVSRRKRNGIIKTGRIYLPASQYHPRQNNHLSALQ